MSGVGRGVAGLTAVSVGRQRPSAVVPDLRLVVVVTLGVPAVSAAPRRVGRAASAPLGVLVEESMVGLRLRERG